MDVAVPSDEMTESSDTAPSLSETRDVDVHVFSAPKIGVGAYLGGPLVATFMLARNFTALGHARPAKLTWLLGGLGSVLLFAAVMVVPEGILDRVPNMVFPLVYTGIAIAVFKARQQEELDAHLAADGKAASGWRVAAIAVLGLVFTVGLVFAFALAAPTMDGERITVGSREHEVFYEPPVTEAEATRVGAALDEQLFSLLDFTTYVKIERTGDAYRVLLPVQDGAWDDPGVVADYRSIGSYLSDALEGADVTIVLFFDGLRGREEHPI